MNDSIAKRTHNKFVASLTAAEVRALLYFFQIWGREDQLPPERAQGGLDWTVWLMLGGRGAGKTRAGAEWVRSIAEEKAEVPPRIALVGRSARRAA